MGVADDEAEAMKAAGLQGGEEGAPVSFSLTEGNADAEDGALAIKADANGAGLIVAYSFISWSTWASRERRVQSRRRGARSERVAQAATRKCQPQTRE